MEWIIYAILIFFTTVGGYLGIIIPNWDLKSFSIYLNRLSTMKLPFKNDISHPKFKSIIFIIFVYTIIDLILYITFIFLYSNIVFLRCCLIYSISKIAVQGINVLYIVVKDRHFYNKEKKFNDKEINTIIENIKKQHPHFFN